VKPHPAGPAMRARHHASPTWLLQYDSPVGSLVVSAGEHSRTETAGVDNRGIWEINGVQCGSLA